MGRAQHGVFDRRQALAAGHTRKTIHYRLEAGVLEALHPTVYMFAGTPQTWERDQMAACLWARAAAHGLAAGRLWQIPGCEEAPIEILTSRSKIVPHAGVIVHFTKRLPDDQLTRVRGIPVTSVERTLLGLGAQWRQRKVAVAIDDVFRRGLSDPEKVDRFLAKTARRGRDGCAVLRRLAKQRAARGGLPTTPLESIICQLLADSHLPMPELQAEILDESGSLVARVDFLYPAHRLIIEGQSFKWHGGYTGWARDMDRFNRLSALGYRILQVTWEDATRNKEATLRRIEATLAFCSTERAQILGLSADRTGTGQGR